jgi:hypothetical protein
MFSVTGNEVKGLSKKFERQTLCRLGKIPENSQTVQKYIKKHLYIFVMFL